MISSQACSPREIVHSPNSPARLEFIEAEIDRLTGSNSEIVRYREKWEEKFEPPFVKNLENVQGDERDVIFISLGWVARRQVRCISASSR